MIKVIIADDQEILREGLKMILSKQEGIEICGLASDGREAYELCKLHIPDIVLMDIKMPNLDGVEATKIIKKDFEDIKIIVLTTFSDDEYIFDTLKNGAVGYLLKDSAPEKIAEAIRETYRGGALIQPDIALKVIDRFNILQSQSLDKNIDKKIYTLTDREIDICKIVGEGKSNKEISKELFIGEGTVKNHITSILNKLDLRDRTQLAIFAIKNIID